MTCVAIGVMKDDVRMNRVSSPAYAGSHGCPSSAVVCHGGWIKPRRNADGCFGGFRCKYKRDHGCQAVRLHKSGVKGARR